MQSAPWQTTTPATPDAGSAEPGTSTATVLLQPIAVHAVGPMPAHPVVTSTSTADAVATPVVPAACLHGRRRTTSGRSRSGHGPRPSRADGSKGRSSPGALLGIASG
ncbi:hypothetical protein D8M35_14015 [Curtobacterium sp. HSID17257]|nr:hypothetical protein D8M35_14015 [Curtobacterium sp. HSID17257]